jgi:stearoyl-CoA desaturase (delta-9 desaturase)
MLRVLLAVLLALVIDQVAIVLTTVYLHRTLAHKALSLSPVVVAIIRPVLWITTGIRPREWVAVHRKHHAFTDTAGDPHSPVVRGYAKVQIGNVVMYRNAFRDPDLVPRFAKDLPADAWDRFVFDHAIVGLGLGIAALCLILGPWLGLLVSAIHAVVYLQLSSAVNAIGHKFGRRPYPNAATNNQWLAWLVAGEGLHNNHHAAMYSARFSFKTGEIDPGWWLIRLLERRGLATVRHRDARRVSAAA